MRLIDADALISAINKSTCNWAEYLWKQVVCDVINNQPTAFDTEKVVEQLLDMRLIRVEQCHGDYEIEVMTESNFDDAIDIVKKGGVREE